MTASVERKQQARVQFFSMYQDPLLYSYFCEAVENNDVSALEVFADKQFWENLDQDEKQKLARLVLKQAELLFSSSQSSDAIETRLAELIDLTDSLTGQCSPIYCEIAEILYRFSLFFNKERYLFCALDRLQRARSLDIEFFDESAMWWHLWAKTLRALGLYIQDPIFFERALKKYQQASYLISSSDVLEARDIYWGWASTWIQLGIHSGELIDFQRGLELFHKARALIPDYPSYYQHGLFSFQSERDNHSKIHTQSKYIESFVFNLAHFQVDYGEALVLSGMLQGDSKQLILAQEFFKTALTDRYLIEHNPPYVKEKAWSNYATTWMRLFFLTGDKHYFDLADAAFQEAIIQVPSQVDLWLQWGELFLNVGWHYKDPHKIETALEKLTASKVKESNPLRLSAFLGRGIVILGFIIEDLELMHEGKKRILSALEVAPTDSHLFFAAGIMHFCFGIYFSEPKDFISAIDYFEKGIEKDSTAVDNLYEIFQVHLLWGKIKQDSKRVRKAIEIIARIVSLRPECPNYLNDWGIALIYLQSLEKKHIHQALIEEAIDKFEKAIQLRDDFEFVYNHGCALLHLGDLLDDEKILEKALNTLLTVHQKFPGDHQVRYHLALAHANLGELGSDLYNLNEAAQHFEQIIAVNKEDETVWCDFGYTLLVISELVDDVDKEKNQQYKALAESKLIRAAELGSVDANYHLACLYSLSGLYSSSMEFLKRAEKANDLPKIEDLENDEWLAGVRQTQAYHDFINLLKQS